jgi:glucose-1-phosphate thymidylyltransferase
VGGIREILIITHAAQTAIIPRTTTGPRQWGIDVSCATQPSPDGLAFCHRPQVDGRRALCAGIGREYLYGHGLSEDVRWAASLTFGACASRGRYGVIDFDGSVEP